MDKQTCTLTTCALVLSGALALPAFSTPLEDQQLFARVDKLNDQCRDSPNAQEACDQRDALMKELESKGWCWGHANQIGADKDWERCEALPRFDVKLSCAQVAESNGQVYQTVLNGCLQGEQSSYNALKSQWSQIPGTIKSACIEVAKSGSAPTYQVLQGCISNELRAASGNKSFEFKY